MTDDVSKLNSLAGIFVGDDSGPRPRCRLCRDTIGWSAERAEGDICRDCAEMITDPETLRMLACWLDNPDETNVVACELSGKQYTLGMIFRKVAVAIETQVGTSTAEPGEPLEADRSPTTAAAGSTITDNTNGKGADDDNH